MGNNNGSVLTKLKNGHRFFKVDNFEDLASKKFNCSKEQVIEFSNCYDEYAISKGFARRKDGIVFYVGHEINIDEVMEFLFIHTNLKYELLKNLLSLKIEILTK